MKFAVKSVGVTLGAAVLATAFSYGLGIQETKANHTPSAMPSSGSCAILLTLPVPYGKNISSPYQTGYNLLGKLTFTSETTGVFNGSIVNASFNTTNSPYIDTSGGRTYLNNWSVSTATLNSSTGFTGGYKMTFSGSQGSFELLAVPTNDSQTILLQSSATGTASDPGLGPGSGVCQL